MIFDLHLADRRIPETLAGAIENATHRMAVAEQLTADKMLGPKRQLLDELLSRGDLFLRTDVELVEALPYRDMFIQRDRFNNAIAYVISRFKTGEQPIIFGPHQIVHFRLNAEEGAAFGTGFDKFDSRGNKIEGCGDMPEQGA